MSAEDLNGIERVRLPVRVVTTLCGDGESVEERSVSCPISNTFVSISHCLRCPRFTAFLDHSEALGPSISCRVPSHLIEVPALPKRLEGAVPAPLISDVMTMRVTTVDPGLGLD